MKNLAIVAIPSQDDYVWKISSEKVPHMTLLFLGDQPDSIDTKEIEEFLQHVVKTSLCRFGMDVDRRGELGENKADVLFFRQYNVDKLNEFRSYLLNNNSIRKTYNSVPQFETFVPHLTLGYPESPAKPDKRDYTGIHWVNFDKIALWIGNYEGPEFPLKSEGAGEEMYMSTTFDDVLAHFGIKGMRWGVRRDWMSTNNSNVARNATANEKVANAKTTSSYNKALANQQKVQREIKADKDWTKKADSFKIRRQVYKASLKQMNDVELPRLNNKAVYKNADFRKDSPLRRTYLNDAEGIFNKVLNKEADRILGPSPSNRLKLQFSQTLNQSMPSAEIVEVVRHAGDGLKLKITWGPKGHIMHCEIEEPLLQFDTAEGILSHFGIKGMQWGVRRSKMQLDSASDDHTRAQEARSKVKKSGIKALSNEELQSFVNRMNLEQQYSRIAPASGSSVGKKVLGKGAKIASEILVEFGKQEARKLVSQHGSKLLASLLKK